MRDPAGPRWRLVDPSGIRIRRFGDDALVFNPLTWETHLLNGAAVRVLDALSADPRAEARIAEEVWGPEAGPDEPDSARGEIGRFLQELGSLGLAEPVREVEHEARRS
jgi:PqqD family protein of HPr-rel-A system